MRAAAWRGRAWLSVLGVACAGACALLATLAPLPAGRAMSLGVSLAVLWAAAMLVHELVCRVQVRSCDADPPTVDEANYGERVRRYRQAIGWHRKGHLWADEVADTLLGLLELRADGAAVEYLEYLAAHASAAEVRSRAEALLPAVRSLAAVAPLLRPADAPAADTLLRPAASADSDPAVLLRAAGADERADG